MPDKNEPLGSYRRRLRQVADSLREHLRQPVTPHLLLGTLLSAGVGGLVFWHAVVSADQSDALAVFLVLTISLGLLLVQVCIQVVIHELGHTLMALLVRLHIQCIKFGPVLLTFSGGKLQVQMSWSLKEPAGYVMAVPPTAHAYRARMALFICGGPVANLIAGVTFLYLGQVLFQQADSALRPSAVGLTFLPPKFIAGFIYVAGVFGIGFAFLNLIPFRITAGFESDGARLLGLIMKRPSYEGIRLLSILGRSMVCGTRPRDWEGALIQKLLACRKGSPQEAGWNLYCYYYFLDKGEVKQAGACLVTALAQYQGYPSISRSALFLEGAYFEARHNSNIAAAFGWLEEANQEKRVEEQTHCRAEAALLWARGRFAEAASRAEDGLKAIPFSADLGGRQAEKDWLEELLSLCQASIAKDQKKEPSASV